MHKKQLAYQQSFRALVCNNRLLPQTGHASLKPDSDNP